MKTALLCIVALACVFALVQAQTPAPTNLRPVTIVTEAELRLFDPPMPLHVRARQQRRWQKAQAQAALQAAQLEQFNKEAAAAAARDQAAAQAAAQTAAAPALSQAALDAFNHPNAVTNGAAVVGEIGNVPDVPPKPAKPNAAPNVVDDAAMEAFNNPNAAYNGGAPEIDQAVEGEQELEYYPEFQPTANATDFSAPLVGGIPATAANFIAQLKSRVGKMYLMGATGPDRFDCSGLVYWANKQLGRTVPRVAADQAKFGVAVKNIADRKPGDLIFFGKPGGRIYHVGVHLGPNMMIDAPRAGKPVRIENYSYWTDKRTEARRIF